MDFMWKELCKFLKSHNLQVSIKSNMTEVNLLDATHNPRTKLFRPIFQKLRAVRYIGTDSSHPPSSLKHLYKSRQAELSANSFNEDIFNEPAIAEQKTVNKSKRATRLTFGGELR